MGSILWWSLRLDLWLLVKLEKGYISGEVLIVGDLPRFSEGNLVNHHCNFLVVNNIFLLWIALGCSAQCISLNCVICS